MTGVQLATAIELHDHFGAPWEQSSTLIGISLNEFHFAKSCAESNGLKGLELASRPLCRLLIQLLEDEQE